MGSPTLVARQRTDSTLVGPYTRAPSLLRLDGRRREVKLLRQTRAELLGHVGPHPSATQRALVEVAVNLTLYVRLFDSKALAAGGLSERDGRQYLAYSNSLTRALARLGLNKAAQEPNPPWLPESSGQPVTKESAREAYFRMLKARPNDAT
jgi:hypothetical protein